MDGFVSQLVVGASNLGIGFTVGWLFKGARAAKRAQQPAAEKVNASAILDVINEVESSAFAQARSWAALRHALAASLEEIELGPHVQSNECYGQLLKAHESHLNQLDPESSIVTKSFKNSLADNKQDVNDFTVDLRTADEKGDAADVGRLVARLDRLEQSNNALCAELTTVRQTAAEQAAELEKTRSAAMEDFLTKLPNRRAFDRRFAEANAVYDRNGHNFCLALVDLDHFKEVNDTHGHDAGDSVLSVTGRVLADTCRTSDFVARFGGEEFVILMPDADLEGAKTLCERIRTRLETTVVRHEAKTIKVTCSIGLARTTPESIGQQVLKAADHLLYQAKAAGRNRVCAQQPANDDNVAPASTVAQPVGV